MMNNLRLDRKPTFVAIPVEIIDTQVLNPMEKVLYLTLYRIAEQNQNFPTTSKLMETLHVKSKHTVLKHIKSLQEKQLLVVEPVFNELGMQEANSYTLNTQNLFFDNSLIHKEIVKQFQSIVGELYLTEMELLSLAMKAYEIHGEKAVRELVVKFFALTHEEQEKPLEGLLKRLEDDVVMALEQTEAEKQFLNIFVDPNSQDKATFNRLIKQYPEGVVQYALESVKGKDAQQNWAYITATIKRLSETCVTYEECVEHKKAYFAKQDTLNEQKKKEQLKKQKLVTRLITLGTFGDVQNIAAYTKKVLADENYKNLDACELFDLLTGENHLSAMDYDSKVFDILYA